MYMERKRKQVLVVDDDRKTVELIKLYLDREGYKVIKAYTGPEALACARTMKPDVIILDLMLPGMDGISVCRTLREESDVAVLMLTARASEEDRLKGLDIGADDYIVKPFSPRELTARVRAVMRRLSLVVHRGGPAELRSGDLRVDLVSQEAYRGGEKIKLAPVEYRLLVALMREPGRVFTREQLVEVIFGPDYGGYDRTVDVHILKLRRKIGDDPGSPRTIVTVHGFGYKWNRP